ncbi:MAG: DNA alkylation repair protein, partial [Clostridiales bacterium]
MSSPTYKTLRPVLESMADEAYRTFHMRLVPGIHDFLGIRIPHLRK